jgi:UPF0755 protein
MVRRPYIILAGVVALAVAGGIGVGSYGWAAFNSAGPSRQETTVVIPKGIGIAGIADLLNKSGVIDNELIFKLGVKLTSEGKSLRAGEYAFPPGVSQRAAIRLMIDGKAVQHKITIPEGLTSTEIYDLLMATPILDGALANPPGEGTLLPETYQYLRGESRAALVDRMRRDMTTTLDKLWAGRDKSIPLTKPDQAVVLASVVEKETGKPDERPRIAAVFYNRLKKNMPLQSDPTVIFAITNGKKRLDRSLTYDDLKTDSPYNTYLNSGLPPSPIANPGVEALKAVLHPVKSKDLYFVADGTGGHAFAETLDQHNKNVAQWRKVQKAATGN